MAEQTANSAITDRKRGVRYIKSEFTPAQKLNGVVLYLHDKGYTEEKDAHALIQQYGEAKDLHDKSVRDIAQVIQDDFLSFSKWVKTL